MLLLRENRRQFTKILDGVFIPPVILPATKPGETRADSKFRANDLAVTARIAGLGVTVVENKDTELLVMASDNESQAVGFARKMLAESKTAEPWFLLLRDENGPLIMETANRSRKDCTLTETGFVLPDGYTVEIVGSYIPAQRNTAWLHSLGHYVGECL